VSDPAPRRGQDERASDTSSFDVVVLGGGPAGLAAALTLRRYSTLSVAVIEKTRYDNFRPGETLSPGIQGLLEYLGVWTRFQADGHLPAYGTSAIWGGPDPATRDFILTPYGAGWHLDRRVFDRSLAEEAAAAGAVVFQETHARVWRDTGGWRLNLASGSTTREITARFMVDATGKAARLARRSGAKQCVKDRLLAVAAIVELPVEAPADTFTLVETFDSGWWYSAKLPGASKRIIAALMSDTDVVRAHRWTDPARWWRQIGEAAHTWERLGHGALAGRPRIFPAYSAYLEETAGDGWIAVGDAAASHDPLSSSGIARALHSGIAAARAIHAVLVQGRPHALTEYSRKMRESFELYWATRLRYYALEARWPASPFWQRRQMETASQSAA
jgi:flavin-dependent dehydrogenase